MRRKRKVLEGQLETAWRVKRHRGEKEEDEKMKSQRLVVVVVIKKAGILIILTAEEIEEREGENMKG